jgi:hypothetical protein
MPLMEVSDMFLLLLFSYVLLKVLIVSRLTLLSDYVHLFGLGSVTIEVSPGSFNVRVLSSVNENMTDDI